MSIYDALVAARAGLRIKKGGSYYMISCPFHGSGEERTPSCSVATNKPVYYCHACGASGHTTALLRRLGMSAAAATRIVERPGTFGSESKPRERVSKRKKRRSRDPYMGHIIPEDALDDLRRVPVSLVEDGFTTRTLMHFEVGFDNRHFRVTYPIRNLYGNLAGVSGRAALEGQTPRYKIYDKELDLLSADKDWVVPHGYTMDGVKKYLLWHAHVVTPFIIQEDEPLILTEGFKACMWTYQAGFKASTALIGSNLSHPQVSMIARVTNKVILFLDNNEAGILGTYEAARRLAKMGIRVQVARYPDDRGQPDDLTADETRAAITDPCSFIEWRRSF